jgi:hypothetical protein
MICYETTDLFRDKSPQNFLNFSRELQHGEIEESITMAWDDLTFDEVQSVFHNWMNRLRLVIENGAEYITE